MSKAGFRRFVAAAACALAVLATCPIPAVAGEAGRGAAAVQHHQNVQIHDLRKDLRESEKRINFALIPVAVLVGILALGGGVGVVFSIRDQRRVSQLHELSVAGEVSSQRRTEQSYGSFFEQSHTTLSLVNETLQLAKEATAQAAKSMDEKAQVRVDAIEEKSQKLMLELFTSREFEVVVADPVRRDELQGIASELRTLEGYLSLQNIKLGDYTKFVKAIDQFINGETEAALSALQLASQDAVVGDLQKYIEYWVGYVLTTVGQYGEAIERFRHDELDLPKNSSQYFQLERIIIDTEFFLLAKPKPGADDSDATVDKRSPRERFEVVASLLDRLAKLADDVEKNESKGDETHTRLEVARTRTDIYEWVAYDRKHLDEAIDGDAVAEARAILEAERQRAEAEQQAAEAEGQGADAEEEEEAKAVDFLDSPLGKELSTDDLLRCWALLEAQAICEYHEDRDSDLAFALAECHFKLGQWKEATEEFEKADDDLHAEIGQHREQRRDVSLRQSLLICHCRLLKLQEQDGETKDKETGHIRAAQREVQEAVKEMGQGRVTVFSQIQRRNLTQEEFRAEVRDIVTQAHLAGDQAEPTAAEAQ